jgi:DNA-binding transcriptional LysR family regulator
MVGRTGGIRKAAASLGVSHAIVSRHLAALEQHLGAALFNRRTGELSEVGKRYHKRISAAFAELENATASVIGDEARLLTIWCSAGFSLHWLAERLPDFHRRARGQAATSVDLRSTDVEPNFEKDDVDGDIRYLPDVVARSQLPGVCTELLVRPDTFPVCSPKLLAKLPPVIRPSDLLGVPLVHEGEGEEWASWLAAQGVATTALSRPVARFVQAHLALMAARSGQGIALANRFLVEDDLARGTLCALPTGQEPWQPVQLGAYYFRSNRLRWMDPTVVRFRRWLKSAIGPDSGSDL